MLIIKYETSFKKDFKRILKRGYDVNIFKDVVSILQKGEPLPSKYKDHMLKGNYARCRECHLTPDWLLIYKVDNEELILYLTRTGSHSDLFS